MTADSCVLLLAYTCPYPGCAKKFSRHDNLNQHARVHNMDNVPIGATLSPGSFDGSRRSSLVSSTSDSDLVDDEIEALSL